MNEAVTIAKVVKDFQKSLPGCKVYVYDNNSTDNTAEVAKKAGAIIGHESRAGKGNVIRRMFSQIEADVYVMVDGDDTYDASQAPELVERLVERSADMVVAARSGATEKHERKGHAFGNRMFNVIYSLLFGKEFTDIFSGYRAFSRRFVKSFPALSAGFEIETELAVHASQLRLPVEEIAFPYKDRPEGSESKLSTFRDGARILKTIIVLAPSTVKTYKGSTGEAIRIKQPDADFTPLEIKPVIPFNMKIGCVAETVFIRAAILRCNTANDPQPDQPLFLVPLIDLVIHLRDQAHGFCKLAPDFEIFRLLGR